MRQRAAQVLYEADADSVRERTRLCSSWSNASRLVGGVEPEVGVPGTLVRQFEYAEYFKA